VHKVYCRNILSRFPARKKVSCLQQ
jgi:hypothetical protein